MLIEKTGNNYKSQRSRRNISGIDHEVIKVAIVALFVYAGRIFFMRAGNNYVLVIGESLVQKGFGRIAESKDQQQKKGNRFLYGYAELQKMND